MFALRAASSAILRPRVVSTLSRAAGLPLPTSLSSAVSAAPAALHASQPARLSSTATAFRTKKQKEWRTRAARGFAATKTHSGCKKRFRFISKFGVVCKHSGAHHKNYHKHSSRMARLRKMKLVPRHLVKRLKVLMPYWKRQMRKEQQLLRLGTEPSVKSTSQISLQRQRVFIEAQKERMQQQLLQPKPWFPRNEAPQQ